MLGLAWHVHLCSQLPTVALSQRWLLDHGLSTPLFIKLSPQGQPTQVQPTITKQREDGQAHLPAFGPLEVA